jgi:hypothetical protein
MSVESGRRPSGPHRDWRRGLGIPPGGPSGDQQNVAKINFTFKKYTYLYSVSFAR